MHRSQVGGSAATRSPGACGRMPRARPGTKATWSRTTAGCSGGDSPPRGAAAAVAAAVLEKRRLFCPDPRDPDALTGTLLGVSTSPGAATVAGGHLGHRLHAGGVAAPGAGQHRGGGGTPRPRRLPGSGTRRGGPPARRARALGEPGPPGLRAQQAGALAGPEPGLRRRVAREGPPGGAQPGGCDGPPAAPARAPRHHRHPAGPSDGSALLQLRWSGEGHLVAVFGARLGGGRALVVSPVTAYLTTTTPPSERALAWLRRFEMAAVSEVLSTGRCPVCSKAAARLHYHSCMRWYFCGEDYG